MKAASISELKKALERLDRDDLLDACVRLAKFKVDNKELLTYVLLKSHDEQQYAKEVCDELEQQFREAKTMPKKTIRKLIRWLDKRIRYSGDVETELEVRICFCRLVVRRKVRLDVCKVSANMYRGQLNKIEKSLEKVHPDLQFDYRQQMEGLAII
jgi:hypothetical protein